MIVRPWARVPLHARASKTRLLKAVIWQLLQRAGYEIRHLTPPSGCERIPDAPFYTPLFSPWRGYGAFAGVYPRIAPHTLVSEDRCYVLHTLALQALHLQGDLWECGVYRGGTALLLADLIAGQAHPQTRLHLFDTFAGMPATDPRIDLHQQGDFADTSLPAAQRIIGHADITVYHPGPLPATFADLEDARIAFAHIDVDIYQSILDCCTFIYPRLVPGAFIVVDDYGLPTCPGARAAVDEFFADKRECPLVLPTGQAVIFAATEQWGGRT